MRVMRVQDVSKGKCEVRGKEVGFKRGAGQSRQRPGSEGGAVGRVSTH